MTAEEPEFYLQSLNVHLFVVMDGLEDMGNGWSIRKLDIVEGLFIDSLSEAFFEVFYLDVRDDGIDFIVDILED